ncbi:MAG: hypothetical protein NC452_06440 [Eubacterium sp.]|nr:hypothetical protein [Eubacterium sp.]
MAKETVNTEGISSATAQLKNINNNIDSSFNTLKNVVNQLERGWNTAVGNTACLIMYQFLKMGETRSYVIQNYINTLEQQVNPGYTATENVNKLLADQFK